jgi:dTDP-4-dehydrorhamnose 3,5-epimerase
MHYQIPPYEEAKLVRCTAGALYDVIIDLRPGSRTYLRHLAVELTAENRRALYIPEGFGHGFITLADNTEIFYQMSTFYVPDSQRGVRYNDPAFSIRWPIPIAVVSDRDKTYPDFVPARG